MNESVIYVLQAGDRVLCEWRELDGVKQHCILGDGIEPQDRDRENYVLAAAQREAEEELDITPGRCETLGAFAHHGVRFHVVLVRTWTGTVPGKNRDNQNELRWVPLASLLAGISLTPLRDILSGVKP